MGPEVLPVLAPVRRRRHRRARHPGHHAVVHRHGGRGNLPNVSFVDPAFDTEGNGTSADDHPLADIRLGERFIADAYHALADAGYLDNTVFVVTFDEWGGFFDHVPPPRVIDDTNPADVDHTGDGTTPTDGQLIPDYTQLGFRVPAIVVSNLAPPGSSTTARSSTPRR